MIRKRIGSRNDAQREINAVAPRENGSVLDRVVGWSGCTRRLLLQGVAAGALGLVGEILVPFSAFADEASLASASSLPTVGMAIADDPNATLGGTPSDYAADDVVTFDPSTHVHVSDFADAQVVGSDQTGIVPLSTNSDASASTTFARSEDVSSLGVTIGDGNTVFAVQPELNQADVYNRALSRVIDWRRDALNDGRIKLNGQTVRDYLRGHGISEQVYLSPKWSNVLERIAIQRALEAGDFLLGHTRPNGTSCFSARVGSDSSSGEILAWNPGTITDGINNWASEKAEYIKEVNGQSHGVTGHYVALIDPSYVYYGFAQAPAPVYGSVFSGEMAGANGLSNRDETPTRMTGTGQAIAVRVSDTIMNQGVRFGFAHQPIVGQADYVSVALNYRFPFFIVDGTWTSSDSSVMTVEKSTGNIMPKAPGSVRLTIKTREGRSLICQVDVTFLDVPTNHWVYAQGWLAYVVKNNLMGGYQGRFAPDGNLTRGQVAAVLYRIANPGSDATTNPEHYGDSTGFRDGGSQRYYFAAVKWLRDQGISTGDKDAAGNSLGTFRPDANITRQELAAMVHRFAKAQGADMSGASDLSGFRDGGEVQPYAREAMAWCNARGVITGGQGAAAGLLMPGQNATRAQAAKIFTVLHRDVMKG